MKLERRHDHKLPTGVLGASLSPDGRSIVAGCMDGVYKQSLDDGGHQKLYAHHSYVSSAKWVREDLILTAGYDGRVCWYHPDTEQQQREIKLHEFWSWDMACSPDGSRLASVTGQYLAGSYKYEPQSEKEPSLCIVAVEDGRVLHQLPHVPSVQSVAFSPDGRHVAAGNLMGEVRVFDAQTGEMNANWTTPDFTSWGIIK
ncbi:MAG: WD40 repeat domain-containing protein, partial [Planctomycetales bacterium]|nr:WD40 repeat domain-containing protein [Planctomycetales bacterium]